MILLELKLDSEFDVSVVQISPELILLELKPRNYAETFAATLTLN